MERKEKEHILREKELSFQERQLEIQEKQIELQGKQLEIQSEQLTLQKNQNEILKNQEKTQEKQSETLSRQERILHATYWIYFLMAAAMLFQLAFNYFIQENVKFGTRLAMTLLLIAFAFMFSFITNRIKVQIEAKQLTKLEWVFVISVIALFLIYSGWTVYDSYEIINHNKANEQQKNIASDSIIMNNTNGISNKNITNSIHINKTKN